MDFKKYASETMEFIKDVEADGCRFPGSPEEKAAAVKIQKALKSKTDIKSRTEKFVFAPNASIGAIDRLGWFALAMLVLYYLGSGTTMLALFGYAGMLAFTVIQIIMYKGWFDFAFKQECAQNIITELPPASGKTDYTIYLGAHYDSSWCWKLAVRNPKTALPKVAYGVVGVLFMIALSIVKLCGASGLIPFKNPADISVYNFFILFVPILFIPGFFFITQFISRDKTIGSPGAMDNLSGVGINMMLMKYYKENPEMLPNNCKLVNLCFAAEEAGLKGSSAYIKAHKDEITAGKSYLINVDSIADADHFEIIKGDAWQGTKFDANLISLGLEAMRDAGVSNPKTIVNPVGGCDSTPFCKAGIPTITIAAQNPRCTDYYHTCNDISDRFTQDTLETGLKTVCNLIQKIGEQQNK
ncbi:MAG: M28 family peptidase [Clostridia bacterium]|nr:M28 family peptidase [Clostridia bacterium]